MKLSLDPTMCVGYGACAQLVPEVVTMDEWGFPILQPREEVGGRDGFESDRRAVEVPAELEHLANRAVHSCPKLALTLRH
jgi:ferredoxin